MLIMKHMMWFYIKPDEVISCPVCDNSITVDQSIKICQHVSFIYHSENDSIYWADHVHPAIKNAIEFEFSRGNILLDCIMTECKAGVPIIVMVSRPEEIIDQVIPVVIVGISLVEQPLN